MKYVYFLVFAIFALMVGTTNLEAESFGRITNDYTVGSAQSVAISGNYAYVADGYEGLIVLDIEDPINPIEISKFDFISLNVTGMSSHTYVNARSVSISENYAYLINYPESLIILNIEEPTNLILEGIWYTSGGAKSVTISGDYAYVADGIYGLKIVNIENPANPTLEGDYYTEGSTRDITISGNYAYVADGPGGYIVLNIEDPANPYSIYESYASPGTSTRNIVISGNYAYIADYENGLIIVDIEDHANFSVVGGYNTEYYAQYVAITGNYLHLADYENILILNIEDPTNLTLEGSYYTDNYAYAITLSGNYSYVPHGYGLLIFGLDSDQDTFGDLVDAFPNNQNEWIDSDEDGVGDNADAFDYDEAASIDTDGDGYPDEWNPNMSKEDSPTFLSIDIFPNDSSEWIDSDEDGVGNNADVFPNDPDYQDNHLSNLGAVGSYSTNGNCKSVVILGNYAYIADGSDGLIIVDIEDPLNPTLEGSYDTSGYSNDVAISGNYAYIADGLRGVKRINIENFDNLFVQGIHYVNYAESVALSGNYLYVTSGHSGIEIISIIDGPNLTLTTVGNFDTSSYSNNVGFSGNYAYIAAGNELIVLDIKDLVNPTLISKIYTGGYAYDVTISGNYVYVADGGDGLKILGFDSDQDTFGDLVDAFPNNPNEWRDSDGDGVGDNADAFDYDEAASIDTDGDGYPDKWNPNMSKRDSSTFLSIDIFPNDSSEWIDGDEDGVGNNADFMPDLSYIQSKFQIALYSILTLGSLYVSVGFYFTKNLITETQKLVEIKRNQGVNTKKVEELISEGRFWFKYFIFFQSALFIRTAERELNLLSDKYESNNRFILQVKDNLELMEKQGPILEKSNDLLEQSKELFFDYKFEESQELVKKAEHIAKETTQTYLSIKENIDELKITIKYFKKKGIKADKLELMLKEVEKEVEEK